MTFFNCYITGSLAVPTVKPEESAFISTSAPGASVISDSTTKENEHQVELSDGSVRLKKKNIRRRVNSALFTPESASSVRQSPRLKVYHLLYFLNCISCFLTKV